MILRVLILASFIIGISGNTVASESDPWTYAYIPLADSANKVSRRLGNQIEAVVDKINSTYPTSLTLQLVSLSNTLWNDILKATLSHYW